MATITLNRKKLEALSEFCKKHDVKKFFLAKDQGAYVGATGGKFGTDTFEQCLFYFAGCNPKTDADWYEEAHFKFGGDDFGEHFDIASIHKHLEDPLTSKMVIRVGSTSISMDIYKKPKPNTLSVGTSTVAPTSNGTVPKAPTSKAPTTNSNAPKKRGVGVIAMEAITEGKSNDEVIATVKAELPLSNPTNGSINWYRNRMTKTSA